MRAPCRDGAAGGKEAPTPGERTNKEKSRQTGWGHPRGGDQQSLSRSS